MAAPIPGRATGASSSDELDSEDDEDDEDDEDEDLDGALTVLGAAAAVGFGAPIPGRLTSSSSELDSELLDSYDQLRRHTSHNSAYQNHHPLLHQTRCLPQVHSLQPQHPRDQR